MAPSATLSQTKSVVAGDEPYQIVSAITAAVEMDTEVFVYTQSTDTYNHVATVYDMNNYPTVNTPNIAYYRQTSATQTYATPTDADAAGAVHLLRVNELVEEYRLGAILYSGSPVVTVLSGTGV